MYVLSVGFFTGQWFLEFSHSGTNVEGAGQNLLRAFLGLGCMFVAGLSVVTRGLLRKAGLWEDIWKGVAVLQVSSMTGTMLSLWAAMNGVDIIYRPAFLLPSCFGLGLAFLRIRDEPDTRGRLF